jgi:hypothetical protein
MKKSGLIGKLSGILPFLKKKSEEPQVRHANKTDEQHPDDDYDEVMSDEGLNPRTDILDLYDIKENYPVPDDVLLPGDMNDIDLTLTEPVGYSQKQVDTVIGTMYNSLKWYVKILQLRNKEIVKLAAQVDKTSTDLHNLKVSNELAEGVSVLTGQPSTAEQDLVDAQIRIAKLQDELNRIKKNTDAISPTDETKYEEIQNQSAVLQLENKKLRAQLKRALMHQAALDDDDIDMEEINSIEPSEDDDILDEPVARIPVGNDTGKQKPTIQDIAAADNDTELPGLDIDLEVPDTVDDMSFDFDDEDDHEPATVHDDTSKVPNEPDTDTADGGTDNKKETDIKKKKDDKTGTDIEFSLDAFDDDTDSYGDSSDELNIDDLDL